MEMYHLSKFNSVDGVPDELQIESWTEQWFQSMLTVLNTFFSYVDAKEAVSRMEDVPFEQLIAEQLEDENDKVIEIAVQKVKELFATEIQFMRAYID